MSENNEFVPEDYNESTKRSNQRTSWRWFVGILTKLVLPVVIITTGVLFASHMIKNKPKSQRQRPAQMARLVEVIPVEPHDVSVTIKAMGAVVPAREVELKSQVAGKIIEMDPKIIPGGLFEQGQSLIRIEPDDYQLLVQQRQSDVANAESSLKLEQGNQAIAKQEYDLLGEEISPSDRELVLRQPQLASAQAALEAAQARLDQAKLDLNRTHITAPFNAVVKDKYVDLGAMVSQSTPLVSLTGTDEYWVVAMVPVQDLKWIQIPPRNGSEGSKVKIYNPSDWDENVFREGQVLHLGGELEEKGRRAQVLISIRDPLALTPENAGKEPLLINSYVRVEIEGRTIPSVVRLDRKLLRDGDNVWFLTSEGTLAIRPMEVAYRGEDSVLIRDGIDPNDQIITTDLATPVEGMALRLPEEESAVTRAEDPNELASIPSAILGDPNRTTPSSRRKGRFQ
jgi:RND family efflux transporter MFP subunit